MSDWRLSYFFSEPFLGSRFMLWSMFWINFLGTVYGYEWYWNQLTYTAEAMSPLLLPFVPDSPTASLFFTCAILYILRRKSRGQELTPARTGGLRGFVEAFAVVTSFKYGIWAVSMIMASAAQGDRLVWQDWMLTVSHLGMAAEALLYFRFYTYRWLSVIIVACWVLWNDYMDYVVGVFPWLPDVLLDDLEAIASYTIALSLISVLVALVVWIIRERSLVKSNRKSV